VAYPEGSDVMVERYIPGDEHRLLVVGASWWPPRGESGLHHRQRPFHRRRTDRNPAQLGPTPRLRGGIPPGNHRRGHRLQGAAGTQAPGSGCPLGACSRPRGGGAAQRQHGRGLHRRGAPRSSLHGGLGGQGGGTGHCRHRPGGAGHQPSPCRRRAVPSWK
jgi:hypothetical protein